LHVICKTMLSQTNLIQILLSVIIPLFIFTSYPNKITSQLSKVNPNDFVQNTCPRLTIANGYEGAYIFKRGIGRLEKKKLYCVEYPEPYASQSIEIERRLCKLNCPNRYRFQFIQIRILPKMRSDLRKLYNRVIIGSPTFRKYKNKYLNYYNQQFRVTVSTELRVTTADLYNTTSLSHYYNTTKILAVNRYLKLQEQISYYHYCSIANWREAVMNQVLFDSLPKCLKEIITLPLNLNSNVASSISDGELGSFYAIILAFFLEWPVVSIPYLEFTRYSNMSWDFLYYAMNSFVYTDWRAAVFVPEQAWLEWLEDVPYVFEQRWALNPEHVDVYENASTIVHFLDLGLDYQDRYFETFGQLECLAYMEEYLNFYPGQVITDFYEVKHFYATYFALNEDYDESIYQDKAYLEFFKLCEDPKPFSFFYEKTKIHPDLSLGGTGDLYFQNKESFVHILKASLTFEWRLENFLEFFQKASKKK